MEEKRSGGQVDIVSSMFFFTILLVTILFAFRTNQYMVTGAYVEDALAASNLASAVIDFEEYGKSHRIRIPNPQEAFGRYREALVRNLHLDDYLNTTNREIICSKVDIKQYIVYNVHEENVAWVEVNEQGRIIAQGEGKRGMVFTPNSVLVENTTIYSKIGFCVEGFMGQQIYAEKENSIDVKRCEGE